MLGQSNRFVIWAWILVRSFLGAGATALWVMCSTSSLLGATLYVGPNETYKTIQAGVDAAKPGDTVIVRDGVYTDTTCYWRTFVLAEAEVTMANNITGDTPPTLIAVARPHHFAAVGQKVMLDGTRSWSVMGKIKNSTKFAMIARIVTWAVGSRFKGRGRVLA